MGKFTRISILLALLVFTLALAPIQPAVAATPGMIVVNWGDTLFSIAARSGTTIDALVRANGLPNPNFVYAGQRLVVPSGNTIPNAPAPAGQPASAPINGNVYTVVAGDTLASVASRFGTTVSAVMQTNGLYNPDFIYTGQRLSIPGRVAVSAPQPNAAPAQPPAPKPAPVVTASDGKWIDIDLTRQTMTAYQGSAPVKSVLISSGVSWHPTPIGRYAIYTKITSQTMSGGYGAEAYNLPGVPWVMYFEGANAIHGAYWHNNFGHPMSHGCINATIADAKWFFDWAQIGTPVITHL